MAAEDAVNVPAAELQVKLVGFKTASKVPEPDQGTVAKPGKGRQLGCLAFDVRNVGKTLGDLYPLDVADWEGADGRVASVTEGNFGCEYLRMGTQQDGMLDQPKPRPRQKVYGTIAFQFPKGRGFLVFADRAGTEMFRVRVR